MAKLSYFLIILIFYFIYKNYFKNNKNILKNLILMILVLGTVITVIIFPEQSLRSASAGLNTWFNVVLPSLLPFFILSEILISLGIIEFIGLLLEPITSKIFNVPGSGSVVYAMSITSGYPVGAKLVTKLRLQKKISKLEGQRLLSFCSTSGPLFMIGAVSVGMLNNRALGTLIALSHYLGALFVGLLFRFYGRNKNKKEKIYITQNKSSDSAFKFLIKVMKNNKKSVGRILNDAVKESMNTIFMIGGFIVFYSVIIEVINLSGILNILINVFKNIIPEVYDYSMIRGILSGMVEITIGCREIASLNVSNYILKISAISFLIGWSGISIHSQALSFINKTDLSGSIYILSKMLHGVISSFLTIILFNLYYKNSIPVSNIMENDIIQNNLLSSWIKIFVFSLVILTFTLLITLLLGIVLRLITKKK